MIDHVLDRYRDVVDSVVIVVNPADRELTEEHLRRSAAPVRFAEQSVPSGMLDAVLVAAASVRQTQPERVWLTWCDQVGISAETVRRLCLLESESPEPAVVMPIVRQPSPYIHFDRDHEGRLTGVHQRREGDPMPPIGTSDAGLFSLSRQAFETWLPEYERSAPTGAATGERNFLPFLPWLAARARVLTFEVEVQEAQGINTPDDLAAVEQRLRLATDIPS
jgi:bifunctional UDP-N-acetylglucosamine pyrophosphorylase/glucosamine-1-phosphate N-acetyltransferase